MASRTAIEIPSRTSSSKPACMASFPAISSALFTLSSVESNRYETLDCVVMSGQVAPQWLQNRPAEAIPQDSAVCLVDKRIVNDRVSGGVDIGNNEVSDGRVERRRLPAGNGRGKLRTNVRTYLDTPNRILFAE